MRVPNFLNRFSSSNLPHSIQTTGNPFVGARVVHAVPVWRNPLEVSRNPLEEKAQPAKQQLESAFDDEKILSDDYSWIRPLVYSVEQQIQSENDQTGRTPDRPFQEAATTGLVAIKTLRETSDSNWISRCNTNQEEEEKFPTRAAFEQAWQTTKDSLRDNNYASAFKFAMDCQELADKGLISSWDFTQICEMMRRIYQVGNPPESDELVTPIYTFPPEPDELVTPIYTFNE